jgi:hypothetical protein
MLVLKVAGLEGQCSRDEVKPSTVPSLPTRHEPVKIKSPAFTPGFKVDLNDRTWAD